jgi:hypothetical protein
MRFIGAAEVLGETRVLLPAATTLMGEPRSLAAVPFVVLCLVGYVTYTH